MSLPSRVLKAALRMPMASGPGIHADQADSVIEAFAQAPRSIAREVRSNPMTAAIPSGVSLLLDGKDTGDFGEAKGKVDSNMVREQLMELAALASGGYLGLPTLPASRGASGEALPLTGPWRQRLLVLDELLSKHRQRLASRKTSWNASLEKMQTAVRFALRSNDLFDQDGKPLGVSWGVLSFNGNKKLPFMAYSELPLVTCPGAGACVNWCYSLKAWRYPQAFARQFLNTLAATVDRSLGKDRVWPEYVCKALAQQHSAKKRQEKTMFLRLFVDGDFFDESTLVAWMESIKGIRKGTDASPYGIEAYGYSKSWHMFIDLAKKGYKFPSNYVVNASSGSRHANNAVMKGAMLRLGVTRGEFKAVEPSSYFRELADAAKSKGKVLVNMTDAAAKARIQTFVEMNGITDPSTALQAGLFLAEKHGLRLKKLPKKAELGEVRKAVLNAWLHRLAADPAVKHAALVDIAKDRGKTLAEMRRKGAVGQKALFDKILAQHLHEVLWAYGIGGSCPLVCGNCSDLPDGSGVHRCAAKRGSAFWKADIHIGLH